jgi:hypothetical protein
VHTDSFIFLVLWLETVNWGIEIVDVALNVEISFIFWRPSMLCTYNRTCYFQTLLIRTKDWYMHDITWWGWDVGVWTGLSWLRTGMGGRHLRMR